MKTELNFPEGYNGNKDVHWKRGTGGEREGTSVIAHGRCKILRANLEEGLMEVAKTMSLRYWGDLLAHIPPKSLQQCLVQRLCIEPSLCTRLCAGMDVVHADTSAGLGASRVMGTDTQRNTGSRVMSAEPGCVGGVRGGGTQGEGCPRAPW